MRQSETTQDIEINFSLVMSAHTACWTFKDGQHSITLGLGPIFEEANGVVEKSRGYSILDEPEPERWPAYDAYVNAFMDILNESFLTELICIERRRQGLRMNRDRCEPCCLARVVAFMTHYTNICLRYEKFPKKAGQI